MLYPGTLMNNLLRGVYQCFEQEDIQYCLLRDGQTPDATPDATSDEIDLLVHEVQLAKCAGLLIQLGFLPLPSFGYAPHHFFVTYERENDRWLKLDIVTRVAYGSPVPVLYTHLAKECLERRQHTPNGYVQAPECELITLLLHCVLDKGNFKASHAQRLRRLRQLVTDKPLMAFFLTTYWLPATEWSALAVQIDTEDWDSLLAYRQAVSTHLSKRSAFPTKFRRIRCQIQRKLNRWITSRSPRALKVALLAPDGAGKSTLVDGIRNSYHFPVHAIYMGLYQKKAASSIMLALPGIGFVTRIFSLWWRCLQAQYYQSRRQLVLFDRYTYDSLLSLRRQSSRVRRWRRWLMAHACPAPALVIVLDAPGEVLYARKGEHSADLLESQRQQYLSLRQNLKQLVVVDATQNADQVRRDVISLIWNAQVKRQAELISN